MLKGNHDNMFVLFAQDDPREDPHLRQDLSWLHPRLGGQDTLRLLRDRPHAAVAALHRETLATVPPAHIAFLDGLPLSFARTRRWSCMPASGRACRCTRRRRRICTGFATASSTTPTDHGALVVHGHTTVEQVELHPNRLALDTGAAYGGPLSAVAIEGRDVYLLTDAGRAPVRPQR